MTKPKTLPIRPGKRIVYLHKGIPVLKGFVKKCMQQGGRLCIYLRQGWSEYVRGHWKKVEPPETPEQASPLLDSSITFALEPEPNIKQNKRIVIIQFSDEESIRIANNKSDAA